MLLLAMWPNPHLVEVPVIRREPKAEAMRIVEMVACRHHLTANDLIGRTLRDRVVVARQEAMAELYATERYSLAALGRLFDGRDHSSVFYAIKQAKARA